MGEERLTYKSAGVDINALDEAKRVIAKLAQKTFTPNVLSEIGLFAGAFSVGDTVLLASTDGVGTKLMVAKMAGVLDTVGEDLVNHCVNDIAVHGATPLFMLDYIGYSSLSAKELTEIVAGISRGCERAGVSLIGGETAQMPGMYPEGIFDLVGFIVGQVEKDKLITGQKVKPSDVIIGLPANGLHTNGYSLARKVLFEKAGLKVDSYIEELGETVGEALLRVHPLYFGAIKIATQSLDVHGMVHITGGGVPGNLRRILPKGCSAEIIAESAKVPKIIELIGKLGKIERNEMYRTFNMGFGLLIIVDQSEREKALELLKEYKPFVAGKIVEGNKEVKII